MSFAAAEEFARESHSILNTVLIVHSISLFGSLVNLFHRLFKLTQTSERRSTRCMAIGEREIDSMLDRVLNESLSMIERLGIVGSKD